MHVYVYTSRIRARAELACCDREKEGDFEALSYACVCVREIWYVCCVCGSLLTGIERKKAILSMHICIHTYIHLCVFISPSMSLRSPCGCTYVHTYTYIYHECTYICTHTYTYIHFGCAYVYTCIHTYIHMYLFISISSSLGSPSARIYVHTYTYIHTVWTYICIHTYICTYS
jgi:hypothetical protein